MEFTITRGGFFKISDDSGTSLHRYAFHLMVFSPAGRHMPVGVSHRPKCAARPKPGRAAQDRLGRALLRPSSPVNSTQIVEVRRHALKNPGGLGAGPQVMQEPDTRNLKNQLAIRLSPGLQFTV